MGFFPYITAYPVLCCQLTESHPTSSASEGLLVFPAVCTVSPAREADKTLARINPLLPPAEPRASADSRAAADVPLAGEGCANLFLTGREENICTISCQFNCHPATLMQHVLLGEGGDIILE